ncbi:MAG: ATP-binding protein [Desulfobulbaceae bacterium]|nr:ATP-binding protein [Desulfobulbaceae bacterium]HIJ78110.1 response regulator [Deltaproteobacteria bacterium]
MFTPGHSHKILVVEDETIIGMEIQSRLQNLGYEVPMIAQTGPEAIAMTGQLRPDLILMDIALKGKMDGIEATEAILAKYSVPVIYLTANTDAQTFQRAKITTPYGYLLKPFEERLLHSTIEMALYKSAMEKELRRYREDLEKMVAKRTEELRTEMEKHKETAKALQISEENYRTIFDNVNDAIFVQECRTGAILDVNQKMTEIYGINKEEACRLTVEDLSAGTDPCPMTLARQYVERATEGEPQLFEWLAKNHQGKIFWVEVSLKCTNIGGQQRLLAVVRDITIRKQAEQALLEAKETAESANRSKSEFLANMNHEIRTPMNHILGMSNLALETELTDQQRRYLQVINESGASLFTILTKILDLAWLEAGQETLGHHVFSIKELVEHTVDSFADQARAKHLTLRSSLSQLPLRAVGDLIKLRQTLSNLIDNAIKFTQSGEVVVAVKGEPTTAGTKKLVHFSVADTGIGIAKDKQRTIFEVFGQADGSTTRSYGGSGLGLALAHKLVEMMGGEISLESTQGQGSTFSFSLLFPEG